MIKDNRFFSTLFDFSFSRFIATKVIGLLYGLAMLSTGVVLLGLIASGFSSGFLAGLGSLIAAPIAALIYLLFIRICLEALVAGIKTAENTSKIREYLKHFKDNDEIKDKEQIESSF